MSDDLKDLWLKRPASLGPAPRRFKGDYTRIPRSSHQHAAQIDALETKAACRGVLTPDIKAKLEQLRAGVAAISKTEDVLEETMNRSLVDGRYTMDGRRDDPLVIGPWLVKWAQHGYNVVSLSNDFVAAMLLSDPAGLELTNVRMPFDGVSIQIPDRFASTSGGGHLTNLHVSQLKRVAVVKDGEAVLDPDAEGLLIDIRACDGRRWHVTTVALEALVADGMAALSALPSAMEADCSAQDTVERIVFGFLAYVTNVERPLVRRARGISSKQRDSTGPCRSHWEIAREVRIDPRLIQAARAGSREIAFRLKHRHIVRGHYRNQPHGQGRQDRKRIWIAPFWKGPEDGAQIVHVYDPVEPTP